jgi:hypothetical protein
MGQFDRVDAETPALGTYADYVTVATGSDSDFMFGTFLSIAIENGSERASYVVAATGLANLTSTTTLLSESNSGILSVNIEYNKFGNAEHTVQVRADSGSGWSAAPDRVFVTLLTQGPVIDLVDQT